MTEPASSRGARSVAVLSALRVHQWSKNLLLFVPMVMAHQVLDGAIVRDSLLAFFSFSLCASGLYLFNDLRDAPNDRLHPKKKFRPVAAGLISEREASGLMFLAVLAAFALAQFLPVSFSQYLGAYLLASALYSLRLKQIVMVDVVALALFYTMRILAGGAATKVFVSQWLLSFSLFIFTSLACLKRFSELRRSRSAQLDQLHGRGYRSGDIDVIALFGASAGYISVLVMVLYINSREVTALYARPELLWLTCPILMYWIGRLWLLAFRGEVDDDPLVFSLRDRTSYLVGVTLMVVMFFAV